jgi:hypothetical protein
MVFAEHTGRDVEVSPVPPVQAKADEKERMNNAGDTSGAQ